MTAAVSPGRTRAVLSAAPSPVVTPQPISATRSSGMSGRICTSAFSCTSMRSAKARRCANCAIGSPSFESRGGSPSGRMVASPSQRFGRPARQYSHVPQNAERQPIT